MSGEYSELGKRLRRFRRAADLTQEELAERTGLSVRGLSDLERGARRAPRRETLDILAEALALAPAERADLIAMATPRRGPRTDPRTADQHHTLPIPTTPLIGRCREREALAHLLESADGRLVTLTGSGGVGKTRLALHVAGDLATTFPAGAYFADLAPLTDPSLVIPAIARTLGVREIAGQTPDEALRAALHGRQLLLLLDNCEHLLAAAPSVAELLLAALGLTVLATSRGPWRIRGEREFPLAPLALPAQPESEQLEHLARNDAVKLFIERATAIQPDLCLNGPALLAIAEICRRLDGLPLAIELAAARTRLLPPAALLDRLDPALPLLAGGARDLPTRQQTMREAIAWSFTLLTPGEQRLLAQLAVFAGGCTIEAAEAVAGEAADDSLAAIESLVEQNLLRRGDRAAGTPRVGMLATIREYALERLEESGEATAIRRQHAEYFLRLAETAAPELRGECQAIWLDCLEAEHDNLRAALGWAHASGEASMVARFCGALRWFWEIRGHVQEGSRWLAAALEPGGAIAGPERAELLAGAGELATLCGEYHRAVALRRERLALVLASGNRAAIAGALSDLGAITLAYYGTPTAQALLQQAQALWRELGDRRGLSHTLFHLGTVARYRGDCATERARFAESLALWNQAADRRGVAASLYALGRWDREHGSLARAIEHLEAALLLRRDLADPVHAAYVLAQLGLCALDDGDITAAESHAIEALALLQQVGTGNLGVAQGLEVLGAVAAAGGDPLGAARRWGTTAALRAMIMAPPAPEECRLQEQMIATTRARIDQDLWADAWAAGGRLRWEEAIAEALVGRPSARIIANGTSATAPMSRLVLAS